MRILAFILNVLLLITDVILIATRDIPSPSKETFYFPLLVVMLSTPIVTLLTLFLATGPSWLSLYFKRKAAEERKRIAELESEAELSQPVASSRK
jgi:uncharacterized integral membrane protein